MGHHDGHLLGHHVGHFEGHLAAGLGVALASLPFDLDYLWLGRPKDVVRGETLVQVGTALSGVTPTGYNPSALNDALFQFQATTDAWRAADASRVTFSQTMIGITIFRARSAPIPAVGNLAGKRDPVAPNLGHEHTVGVDGRVTLIADSAGGQITLQITDDHVVATLPHIVVYRVRPGFADLETLYASRTGVLPAGTLSNAVQYAIGRQRVLASASLEIGLHGVAVDQPYLALADLRDEILWPIAKALILAENQDVDGNLVLDAEGQITYSHSYPYV